MATQAIGGKILRDRLPTEEEVYEIIARSQHADILIELLERVQVGFERLNPGSFLHPMQILAVLTSSRMVAIDAGRRVGKSQIVALLCACYADPVRGREYLKARGVKGDHGYRIEGGIVVPDLKNQANSLQMFRDALDVLEIPYKENKTQGIIGLPSLVDMQSIVTIKSVSKDSALRGNNAHWGWWEEAAFIKGEASWDNWFPSTGRYLGCVFLTTTPSDNDSNWWLWNRIIAPALGEEDDKGKPVAIDEEIEYLTWYADEAFHIDKKEIRRAARTLHPMIYEREYRARWAKNRGAFFQRNWIIDNYFEYRELHLRPGTDLNNIVLERDLDRDMYDFAMGIDPSTSKEDQIPGERSHKKERDPAVGWVIARDRLTGVHYFIDGFRDRFDDPMLMVELVETLVHKWGITNIGVESNGFQVLFASLMRKRLSKPLPVQEMMPEGEKKARLLARLPGPFRTKKARMPVLTDSTPFAAMVDEFLNEWVTFPRESGHDDCLDAAEYAIRACKPFTGTPGFVDPKKPVERERLTMLDLVDGGSVFPTQRTNYDETMGVMY